MTLWTIVLLGLYILPPFSHSSALYVEFLCALHPNRVPGFAESGQSASLCLIKACLCSAWLLFSQLLLLFDFGSQGARGIHNCAKSQEILMFLFLQTSAHMEALQAHGASSPAIFAETMPFWMTLWPTYSSAALQTAMLFNSSSAPFSILLLKLVSATAV